MTTTRIFYAWMRTVLAGSFFISLIGTIRMGEFSIMFIFAFTIALMAVSAFLSTPALIAMLVVSERNKNQPFSVKFRKLVWTHALVYAITMIGGNLYSYLEVYGPSDAAFWNIVFNRMLFFSEITTGYAATAAIIWIVMFRKEWMENKLKLESTRQTQN